MQWEFALELGLSAGTPLLKLYEWNNLGQPETPARQSSRVISERKLAFFQPIAVLAAARYFGAATTYLLLSPKISKASSRIGRSSGKIGQLRIPRPSWCSTFGSGILIRFISQSMSSLGENSLQQISIEQRLISILKSGILESMRRVVIVCVAEKNRDNYRNQRKVKRTLC